VVFYSLFPLNPSLLSHPLDWDRTYQGAADVAHRCIFIPRRSHLERCIMEGGHNDRVRFSTASPLVSPPSDSFPKFPPRNDVLWPDSLRNGRVLLAWPWMIHGGWCVELTLLISHSRLVLVDFVGDSVLI
jgi:hypothetical protein